MSSDDSSKYELIDQLAEEITVRYRKGERPSLAEYTDRYPELADDLRELLPAMVEIEQVKAVIAAPADEAPAVAPPLRQLGDYHILREIGRGGMGVVYEAEQLSLGRRVALKVLSGNTLHDARQRRRFEREAKAAAKLHHTNIVPVYGVGEQDGTPYYVMQLIGGLGLDGVIDELRLLQGGRPEPHVARHDQPATGQEAITIDELPRSPGRQAAGSRPSDHLSLSSSSLTLLGLGVNGRTYWRSVANIGVQVASALEHAHQQGVLHRDVKPSNLLLDTAGTVWVTDFGLAKADDQQNLTDTGDILGTLRYMAPEAFDGTTGARSDVYSLGLTLYELLALRPAFDQANRNRLIEQVTRAEVPLLSSLNPSIPRDLVTIVHKASEREPAQRYSSAGELAADLQRFLDDEPIQARRPSRSELLWRWCRRHPGVAGLSAALALILVGVTVLSALAAGHFNRLAGREVLAAANERKARQAAEANFAMARKAVDDYYTLVSENRLLQVPGMQELRLELLQSALAFYKDFLKERGGDPSLLAELAATYLRVGRISAEIGAKVEAREALLAAREGYETALRDRPGDLALQAGLADCWHSLAGTQSEPERALEAYQKAVEIRERLVRDRPREVRYSMDLADAYNSVGAMHSDARRPAKALEFFRKSVEIRLALAREGPDDPALNQGLFQSFNNIAVQLSRMEDRHEALAMHLRANEYGRAAFDRMPYSIDCGIALAAGYENVARAYSNLGQKKEALRELARRAAHLRALAANNPAVPRAQSQYLEALKTLAFVQRQQGLTAEADQSLRLARAVIERLPNQSPSDLCNLACFRASYAALIGQAGPALTEEERGEQLDLAVRALERAIAAGYRNAERLERDPDLAALRARPDFKKLVANLRETVAARKRDLEQAAALTAAQARADELARNEMAAPAERLKAEQEVFALRVKLGAGVRDKRRHQADLATSQQAIGRLRISLGQVVEGKKSLEQALALREALEKGDPKNLQLQADVASTRLALADLHWTGGKLAEAARESEAALQVLRALCRADPKNDRLAQNLAAAEVSVGISYGSVGAWAEAADHFARSAPGLAYHWHMHAHLLLAVGDAAGYRRLCEKMLKLYPDDALNTVRTCTAAATGFVDPPRLVRLAETELRNVGSWARGNLAMAYHRAGQYEKALKAFEDPGADYAPHWPGRAMTLHQLGRTEEAREWLRKIDRWYADALEGLAKGSDLKVPTSPWWADWARFEILRREAHVLIQGSAPPDQPLPHLLLARVYFHLQRPEKADAEFQAAIAARPGDPAVWLARARMFLQLGRSARAEADFAGAVKLKSNDPGPWIEHGRYLAGRGWHREADAAFAQAASLTPGELNRFLEAGWWVVGPYPGGLMQSCPPEKDPDPSRPVAAVGKNEELRWRPVAGTLDGMIDFGAVQSEKNASSYALAYIYAPVERTATLLVAYDPRRLWLNGRLVHESTQASGWRWEPLAIPVSLRAGRNTLLVKVSQASRGALSCCRLADGGYDRGFTLARLGLFKEACAAFTEARRRYPEPEAWIWPRYAQLLVGSGDRKGYLTHCRWMLDKYRPGAERGEAWAAEVLANALLAAPNYLVEPDVLVRLAELAANQGGKEWWRQLPVGLAMYRAGRFDRAVEVLTGFREFRDHVPEAWAVLAMAEHRAGNAVEAKGWLVKFHEWFDKESKDAATEAGFRPFGNAPACNLGREAIEMIEGSTADFDRKAQAWWDRTRAMVNKLGPDTREFDLALWQWPDQPRLWLARGRRLLELKREKEAAADLARAAQLAPKEG